MPEILPGIHQVEGVDPSPDFTTHVYLVREPTGGYTLIDTGVPGSEGAIVAYLKKIGSSPKEVSTILITHLHNDHTGSLKRLKGLTNAKVYAHWLEAAWIAGRPKYDGPGSPPSSPMEVDVRIKDGDPIPVAGGLVAYHTPGHTPGHTAYYSPARKLVFSGDLFFGLPKLGLTVPDFTHHMQSAQISARRLTEIPIDSILSYHGGPFLHGAGAELQALVKTF
jgi:glyoxylase-like metal-dependent hydrolase (beta-lactamase superfamily II)